MTVEIDTAQSAFKYSIKNGILTFTDAPHSMNVCGMYNHITKNYPIVATGVNGVHVLCVSDIAYLNFYIHCVDRGKTALAVSITCYTKFNKDIQFTLYTTLEPSQQNYDDLLGIIKCVQLDIAESHSTRQLVRL